jgi:hypothetical protein
MGAAEIGGVGCGLFEDFSAVNRFITIKDRQKPDPVCFSDRIISSKARFGCE